MTHRFAAVCVIALACLALPAAASAALREIAGLGNDPGQVKAPTFVAINGAGELVVGDAGNTRVQKLTRDGAYLSSFATPYDGSGYYPTLYGDVGPADDIYVGLRATGSNPTPLYRYSTQGALIGSWGAWDGTAAAPNDLHGIAVGDDGSVYALAEDTTYGAERVAKYAGDGTYIGSWQLRDGAGRLRRGVAIAARGNVVVVLLQQAGLTPAEVVRYDGSGNVLSRWTGEHVNGDGLTVTLQFAEAIAIDAGGDIFASGGGLIQRFSSAGDFRSGYDGANYTPQTLPDDGQSQCGPVNPDPWAEYDAWYVGTSPDFRGVTVDSDGTVYAADSGRSRIVKFDGTPKAKLLWGPQLSWAALSTGERVVFDGSLSSLPFGSITKYEWDLDGDGTFETDSGSTARVTKFYGTPGKRTVQMRVTGSKGLSTIASQEITVAATQAHVWAFGTYLTGHKLKFDASSSEVQCGSIIRYQWDLDDDGTYETDTGTSPTTTRAFADPGERTVRVRVTRAGGRVDEASQTIDIALAPPPGEMGVTINDGAQYTNDPVVNVNPVWAPYSKQMIIANDGGFRGGKSFGVSTSQAWRLDSSGPERLPKTIYVRFDAAKDRTFTDDIILDETKPLVTEASIVGGQASPAASAARRHSLRLRVRARDNASGVGRMQVTKSRKHPGKWRRMRRTTRVAPAARLWVRVRDRAGNRSHWRRARR